MAGCCLTKKARTVAIVDTVVPQRVLGAAAEQRGVRPARIGVDEGGVALEAGVGVVGAQDHPFGEFARDRIADARLGGIGVGFLAFARGLDHALDRSDIGGGVAAGRRDCERPRDGGRASGLNVARRSNSAPCRPTLACAKAERPALSGRTFLRPECGLLFGASCAALAALAPAAGFATWTAGRGRGKGTFFAAGLAPLRPDSAQAAVAAVGVK